MTTPKNKPRRARTQCQICRHWQSNGELRWRAVCSLREGVAGITARTMSGFGCDEHDERETHRRARVARRGER